MKRIFFAAALMLAVCAAPVRASAETETPVLRAGDMVMIQFPGEAAFDTPFQVSREGEIDLPEAGAVRVAGETENAAQTIIKDALSRIFRSVGGITVNVAERRLSVTVLGFVKQPGPADLPAGAGVQVALSAAGGLAEGAQLDRLQIRRGAEVLTFDYKKYLDTGDLALLPELRPLDVVFAPASPLMGNVQTEFEPRELVQEESGSVIHVLGAVNKPGRISLDAGMTFLDILSAAGGPRAEADLHNLAVTRPKTENKGARRVNLARYFQTGNETLLPELGVGDVIYVPERGRAYIDIKKEETVRVLGSVLMPGRYAYSEDMTVLDLLARAGGPTGGAWTGKITVANTAQPGAAGAAPGAASQSFDLDAFAESGDFAALPAVLPGATVYVPNEKEDPTYQFRQTIRDAVSIITIGSLAFGG
ncbi:MAG: polysaccharide biosynthesis/export family protein [Rhodospirillales bacterium]